MGFTTSELARLYSRLILGFLLGLSACNDNLVQEAATKMEHLTGGEHTFTDSLSTLPPLSHEYSRPGLLFLGPSIHHHNTFSVAAVSAVEFSSCIELRGSHKMDKITIHNFRFRSTCELESKFTLTYSKNKTMKKPLVVYHSDIPNLSCNGKHLAKRTTYLFTYPPGVQVLVCPDGTIRYIWDLFNDKKPGCVVYYWRSMTIPCGLVGTRSLLSLSCEVEVETETKEHPRQVSVSLHGSGEIKLVSNTFVKTDICHESCVIPIGESTTLQITCPDGSEYNFNLQTDLRDKCSLSGIPVINYVSLFLCKSSYHPYILIVFILWFFLGNAALTLSICSISYIVHLINKCMRKTSVAINPELACCSTCHGKILCESHVGGHNLCSKGKCAFCSTYQPIEKLAKHVVKCTSYMRYMVTGETDMCLNNTLLGRASERLREFALHSTILRIVSWLVTVIIFFLIISPPFASAEEEFLPFYDPNDYISNDRHGYFEELADEVNQCGTTCFHHPLSCRCSETPESTINEIYLDYRGYNRRSEEEEHGEQTKLERVKRGINTSIINVKTVINKDIKLHKMKTLSSKASSNKLLHLPLLSQLLTSWGIVSINHLIEPSANLRNIETSWTTTKKEKKSVFVKGTAVGKLKLTPNTGLAWSITSPDSNEKKTLSLYIHSVAQIYKTTLKYYTASRTLLKWFKGTCTGTCDKNCGCSTSTCYNYLWNYDRGWGCNPTWCWTINGGCSCCAVDVLHDVRKWVLGIFSVEYVKTEVVYCLNEGHDKVNCHVGYDNEKIKIGLYTLTLSKAYAIDRKLPARIGFMWYNKKDSLIQSKHPLYFLDNPESCDTSCNHGDIGDYKSWDIQTASGITGHAESLEVTLMGTKFRTVMFPRRLSSQAVKIAQNVSEDGEYERSDSHGGDWVLNLKIGENDSEYPRDSSGKLGPRDVRIVNTEHRTGKPLPRGRGAQEMSYVGMEVGHDCHVGHWPDCTYNNMQQNLDEQFERLNKTTKHLTGNFIFLSVRLGVDGQSSVIAVQPKSGYGMIDFTIQGSNIVLTAKDVKIELKTLKIKKCEGCYACSTGFRCTVSVVLSSPKLLMVHFKTSSPFIVLDTGGYNLNASVIPNTFEVKGGSILKNSSLYLCIEEAPALCVTHDLILEGPMFKIVKREEVINIKGGQEGATNCTGFGYFSCSFSNLQNLGLSILDWAFYIYYHAKYFFYSAAVIICLVVFAYIAFKVLCKFRRRNKPILINPSSYKQGTLKNLTTHKKMGKLH